jgi:guanine nucleotide-binding protein G(i) subunit alpha
MKIINQNGFTRDELLGYRQTIYKNLVDSAQAIILQMRKLQIDCEVPENRVRGLIPVRGTCSDIPSSSSL